MPNYLTQEDLQNYGTDLVDFSLRAAHQATAPQLEYLRQQNEQLQRQLGQEAKARLDMRLDAAIPDWRVINADPRWLQWLQGIDSFNGISRQRLLDTATARGDASRVIRFFRDFLQQAGGQARSRTTSSKPIYSRAQLARCTARTGRVPIAVVKPNGPVRRPTSTRHRRKGGSSAGCQPPAQNELS